MTIQLPTTGSPGLDAALLIIGSILLLCAVYLLVELIMFCSKKILHHIRSKSKFIGTIFIGILKNLGLIGLGLILIGLFLIFSSLFIPGIVIIPESSLEVYGPLSFLCGVILFFCGACTLLYWTSHIVEF